MPTCVQADQNGVVSVITPQPADFNTCTLVLAAPAEIAPSPLAMSVEDAIAIGSAIWLAWAMAWAARILIRALNVDSHSGD